MDGSQSTMEDWDADLSPCNFATTHLTAFTLPSFDSLCNFATHDKDPLVAVNGCSLVACRRALFWLLTRCEPKLHYPQKFANNSMRLTHVLLGLGQRSAWKTGPFWGWLESFQAYGWRDNGR